MAQGHNKKYAFSSLFICHKTLYKPLQLYDTDCSLPNLSLTTFSCINSSHIPNGISVLNCEIYRNKVLTANPSGRSRPAPYKSQTYFKWIQYNIGHNMRIIPTSSATIMYRICIVFVLMKLVCASSLYPSPISSQSSTVLDDHSTQKKDDVFKEETKKGVSNSQTATGFNNENEKKTVIGQDRGKYNQENVSKNHHEDSGQRQGENFHQVNSDSVNKFGRKGGHRKGHHKTGYHNSYHKDESENNSSYYDDNDDQGGHFVYDSRAGSAGQSEADRFRGMYDNGRINNEENVRRGQYDVGGHYGNERDDKRAYDQRQYFNDRRDKSNSNIGNVRGETGRNYAERHYQNHPQYYQSQHHPIPLPPINQPLPPINQPLPPINQPLPPINQPLPPINQPVNQPIGHSKKTITIYEDPRVFDLGYRHPMRQYPNYEPRYDSDLIHLDFRRSPMQYNRRQFYDYYQ